MATFPLPFEINGYKLKEEIGGGSFSTVYLAVHIESGEKYAVKVINKNRVGKENDIIRLQREIDAMAFLKHKSIVKLNDFFTDVNNFYLILDYCPGGDLYTAIETTKNIREPVIANIFKQIVSAIEYCHARGVAHRDLKPDNILITTFPNIKVSDFGLCGYASEGELMKSFCGSPYYLAPECLNNVKYDGKKSDMWSLGVILFEISTGEHPWSTNNAPLMLKQIKRAQFNMPRNINPALEDLIRSLIKVKPSERLDCQQVLKHPWMNMAGRAVGSKLPPLRTKPVFNIVQSLKRDRKDSESGIFSPFTLSSNIMATTSEQNLLEMDDKNLAFNLSKSSSYNTLNRSTSKAFHVAKKTCLTSIRK